MAMSAMTSTCSASRWLQTRCLDVVSHSKNLAAYSPKVKGFFYHPTGVVHMEGVTKSA